MKKYLILFTTIIALDLSFKQFALWQCPETVAINRGISWSLITPESTSGFVAISLVIALFVALFMIYTWIRFRHNEPILAELFICSGAFANLLDRPMHGGVVDFIALGFCGYQWPLFNLADIAIVTGVLAVLAREVYKK
ncbi:TPA: hypothetical protein DDZ86_02740 [Candidatus Dependentiae bacterium]|nr:MAG: Lipoprotein signal peptidase [candidate division TM6 bacterium GW2011_GWF2_43_87]HBL98536.1 hypothetical protein [Candidatus Dependentiae bacterium]